jgi:LysM repeat protein
MHYFSYFIFSLLLGGSLDLQAVPRPGYYDQDQATSNRETKDSVDMLRHQLNNQEAEIRTFEQKLESLDAILDTLRDQLKESSQNHKEMVKGSSSTLEGKIATLETTAKTLTQDLKQLHSHANESSQALAAFKDKLQEIEKRQTAQNKNIDNLQSAVQSILEALQIKSDPAPTQSAGGKTYKIKNGDTLEKIAKAHNTTIQALKEINGMNSDKIVVGKTLKIPD